MNTSTQLTNEQHAGQRLMLGFDGTKLNDTIRHYIDTLKTGGLILFARNVVDPDQVGELCFSAQEYAKSVGQPPLFISIDQEGGVVARLKKPFTEFPGNPDMQGVEDAVYFAETTAKELNQVGINMNLAPVLDIAPLNFGSIMEKRSFGSTPEIVSELGITVINKLQESGIMAVAKHFPGIGRTRIDSHFDLPVFEDDLDALKEFDLIPFVSAIENDVAGIMLSHILYTKLDPDWSAGMSEIIAKGLLRKTMGYTGLILTDDLDMGALANHHDINAAITRNMEAEIDICLICHESPKTQEAFDTIVKLIETRKEAKVKAQESTKRILAFKKKYFS